MNRVVPCAVEASAMKIDVFQFCVRDFDAGGVPTTVDLPADFQTLVVGGVADELHHDFVADERLAAPVETDLAEHAVFDFVPGSYGEAGRSV